MQNITLNKTLNVSDSFDVIVCGGGIAGISAALAAARNGAKVLLAEREYLLGGLATLGLVAIYLPISDGNGNQISCGIAEELLKLSVKHGTVAVKENKSGWMAREIPEDLSVRCEVQFDPNVFSIEAEKLLIKNGVKIIYGAGATDVIKQGNEITHIVFNSRTETFCMAAKTVVDATGDATICALSGERTCVNSAGNKIASWYYEMTGGELKLHLLGFSDVASDADSDADILARKNEKNVKRYSGVSAEDTTEFCKKAHENLLADFLKNGKVDKFRSLTSIAALPQLRMTRRLDGAYIQNENEVFAEYSDSVGMFVDWRKTGSVYELPFGCICGNTIKNLFTAGRCISSAEGMWDVTRAIPVCAVSGQAAGTAAALRTENPDFDIALLQEKLIMAGVKLHKQ